MEYTGAPTPAADLNLSPGYKGHISAPLLQDGPVAVCPLPGSIGGAQMINSDAPPHLYFVEVTAERLDAWHKETVAAHEASGAEQPPLNYVANPNPLLSVSGYLMRPTVYPTLRNYLTESVDRLASPAELSKCRISAVTALSKDEGGLFPNLRHFISRHHRDIFSGVTGAYFAHWCPGTIWIPYGASSGFWTFSRDREIKERAVDGAGEVRDAWAHSEEHGRAFTFDRGGGLVAGKAVRSQGEPPGKVRKVQTFTGETVVADKELGCVLPAGPLDGPWHPTKAKRRRQRHANGTSAEATTGEQIVLQGFDRYALKRFAYTWKHRHKRDLDAKLAPWRRVTVIDYSQFDEQNSAAWAGRFNDILLGAFVGSNQQAFERLLHLWDSPAFLRAEYDKPPSRRRWTLIGDPLKMGPSSFYAGQLSGLPRNPRFNRCSGTASCFMIVDMAFMLLSAGYKARHEEAAKAKAQATILQRALAGTFDPGRAGDNKWEEYRLDLVRKVETILEGKWDIIAVLNSGDDCVIADTNRQSPLTAEEQDDLHSAIARAATFFPYMQSEPDPRGKFLGYHICEDATGLSPVLVAVPSLISFDANFWMPEYDFGDPRHRPDAAAGYPARIILHYAWHPLCQELFRRNREDFKVAWRGADPASLLARYTKANMYDQPYTVVAQIWPHGVHTGRFAIDDLSPEFAAAHYIRYEADDPRITAITDGVNPLIKLDEETVVGWEAPDFEFPQAGWLTI